MNDLRWIEPQMASWKPRRPSPRVEEALFSPTQPQPLARARSGRAVGWELRFGQASGLAAACFVVLGALFLHLGFPPEGLRGAGRGESAFAALSNQSFTAYLTLDRAKRNSWRTALESPILGWTNEGPLPSNAGSLDFLNTNVLLPKL